MQSRSTGMTNSNVLMIDTDAYGYIEGDYGVL